jgi:hypothetical protein
LREPAAEGGGLKQKKNNAGRWAGSLASKLIHLPDKLAGISTTQQSLKQK